MVWPPAMVHLASTALSWPPFKIRRMVSLERQFGTHKRFMARVGCPPIAYTSLREFAAATCPNIYGSSTTGVKKSTVWIAAISSVIFKTHASSAVSNPTIRSGFGTFGRFSRISLRTPGPNLAAQPGVEVIWVSGTSFAMINLLKNGIFLC